MTFSFNNVVIEFVVLHNFFMIKDSLTRLTFLFWLVMVVWVYLF